MMPPLRFLGMALRWELPPCLTKLIVLHPHVFLHLAHQLRHSLGRAPGETQPEGTVLQPLLGGIDDGSHPRHYPGTSR